jgi:hypothetical protein
MIAAGRSESELAEALERIIVQRPKAFADAAIVALYGELPEWFPAPVFERIRRAIDSLGNAHQSIELIVQRVAALLDDKDMEIPGTARDVDDFIKSVNELAHVKWALSRGKEKALHELAGRDAALGEKTRAQRRTYSELGNANKKKQAEEKKAAWLAIGTPLRARHPNKSDAWLAREIARNPEARASASTIRQALPTSLKKKT